MHALFNILKVSISYDFYFFIIFRRTEGLNQKPKSDEQEIPKKVRLMMAGKGPYKVPERRNKTGKI